MSTFTIAVLMALSMCKSISHEYTMTGLPLARRNALSIVEMLQAQDQIVPIFHAGTAPETRGNNAPVIQLDQPER